MKKIVVLISGKLRSGKDQLCTYMRAKLEADGYTTGQVSFAKPLKDGVWEDFTSLFNYLHEKRLEMLEAGAPPESVEWLITRESNIYEDKTGITRALLQIYGTEIFRRRVSDTYWVDKCVQAVNDSSASVVFVTDVRYPNELDAFLDWYNEDQVGRHAASIRIERPDFLRGGSADEHTSEKALDDHSPWDFLVDNSGSLEDLMGAAEAVTKAIQSDALIGQGGQDA